MLVNAYRLMPALVLSRMRCAMSVREVFGIMVVVSSDAITAIIFCVRMISLSTKLPAKC